jgi:transcriptional regulator with XRE-family HTH domain
MLTTSNEIHDKMFLMDNKLADLLNSEMATRGWSQSDLARKSGLNRAVINKILSGNTKPTTETCRSLAEGLDLPIEQIYRAAGILPPKPKEDPLVDIIAFLAKKLPTTADKEEAIKHMKTILEIAEARGKYDNKPKKRP